MSQFHTFDDLIGRIPLKIEQESTFDGVKALSIWFDDLRKLRLFNSEEGTGNDCTVVLVDVEGDFNDLIGRPLTKCEYVSQTGIGDPQWNTWTFYRLASDKGFVTLRWGGTSNGYYSEVVEHRMDTYEPNEEYYNHLAHEQNKIIHVALDLDDTSLASKKPFKL